MLMRQLIIAIIFGLLPVAAAPSASACSCIEQTIPQAVESSAAIFTGKVVRLEVVSVTDGVSSIEVTVEIEEIFKGAVPNPFVLTTSDGCCYCAPSFDIAKFYLFFAHRFDGKLDVSGCSRTKLLSAAKEELEFLGTANGAGGD
jgi:hypothetical protein